MHQHVYSDLGLCLVLLQLQDHMEVHRDEGWKVQQAQWVQKEQVVVVA